MAYGGKEQQNSYQINVRLILSLIIGLGLFSIILFTTMLSTSGSIYKKTGKKSINTQEGPETVYKDEMPRASILATVKKISLENKQIELYDILGKKDLILKYTGGSNITDEFGQIVAVSRLSAGIMVDVSYIKDSRKITDMSISTKAWKYVGVSNFTLSPETDIMRIAKKNYRLADDLVILDGDELIPISDLAEQDILTVWGYEETVWSIVVTRGHGYVVLQDYSDYLGDFITIGYEAMQQISENMVITVREGDYSLTVENGAFSASKRVNIKRNEITYVSLQDLGPKAKYGSVLFEISPFGADLYINGVLKSYAGEIELLYGSYTIEVSLDGYVSYKGVLNIDSPGKTMKISLPETSGNQKVEISEINTQNNNGNNSQGTTGGSSQGTGQDTNQGSINGSPQAADDEEDLEQDVDYEDDESGSDYKEDGDNIIDTKHLIHIQYPIGASVYVNGEYMGKSPVSFNKIIGSHIITFIKEGYETKSYFMDVINDGKDAYFSYNDFDSKQ
jgi:hypothetical protein